MDIFSKIAAGEIPSYKCAENEEFYAFLDINPLVKGHTLVIPRREVDYFFDMEDDELARYQQFAKRVAIAIQKAFPCKKVPLQKGCPDSTWLGSCPCTHPPHSHADGG